MANPSRVLLVAAATACLVMGGCIEVIARSDATVVTIPAAMAGQRASYKEATEGFTQRFSASSHQPTIEPLHSRALSSSSVDYPVPATDAWSRPFDAVKITGSYKATDGAKDDWPSFESYELYEPSSRLSVAQSTWMSYASRSCSNTACTWDNGTVEGIQYPRDREEYGWASLEGVTLHVGDRIVRENILPLDGAVKVHVTITYEVVRSETVGDARTLVVSQATKSKLLNLSPIFQDDSSEPEPGLAVPAPVRLLWYADGIAVPVRTFWSHAFAHSGRIYYTNSTGALSEYTAGTQTIPWGQATPLPPPEPIADADATTPAAFFTHATGNGVFNAQSAWEHMSNAMTSPSFRAYLAAHPGEVPAAASHVIDTNSDRRYWNFQMGDTFDRTPNSHVVGSARSVPVAAGIRVIDDRDSAFPADAFVRPLDGASASSTRILTLAAAKAVADRFQPTADPMMLVTMGTSALAASPGTPRLEATFGPPARSTVAPLLWTDFGSVRADTPVSVNLADGGLNGVNTGLFMALVFYPLVPSAPLPTLLGYDPDSGHAFNAVGVWTAPTPLAVVLQGAR